MSPRLSVWLIVLVVLFTFWANLPKLPTVPFFKDLLSKTTGQYPVRLGLDLQGGTECVLEAKMDNIDPEDRDNALTSAKDVIEKRVNLYGVSEAVVQSSRVGDQRRILVELPGANAIDNPCSSIGQTALLEFRELPASMAAVALDASGSATYTLDNTQSTGLTGKDLKRSAVGYGSGGTSSGPQVELTFTDEGAQKFADITKRNIGKPLIIFLDQQEIEHPNVSQEILGGQAVINGSFTAQTAKDLAVKLNAGALPISLTTLSQQTIPASLGNESIQKSLLAG